MSNITERILIMLDVLLGKYVQSHTTVSLFATSTGTIPKGAVSYSITNLGESALDATFHPWTLNGVQNFLSVKNISDTTNGLGSFSEITYDADPTSTGTPNTLLIQYKVKS